MGNETHCDVDIRNVLTRFSNFFSALKVTANISVNFPLPFGVPSSMYESGVMTVSIRMFSQRILLH